MSSSSNQTELLVKDVFRKCDYRVCDADSMEDVVLNAPDEFAVIPVFDYAQKYVGGLQPRDFVRFLKMYFENLNCDDRGNEFVMEKDSSDIQFVPIDRVSRYVDSSVQPVGLDEPIEQIANCLCEQGRQGTPVFDADNHIVGTISMRDIVEARLKKNCECDRESFGEFTAGPGSRGPKPK